MDPKQWGPMVWGLWDDIVFWSDTNDIETEYFSSTGYFHCFVRLLPCKHCRATYERYIRDNPVANPLTKWVWNLHNAVNRHCRKSIQHGISYPQYIRKLKRRKRRKSSARQFWTFLTWCLLTAHVSGRMITDPQVRLCFIALVEESSSLIPELYGTPIDHSCFVKHLLQRCPSTWLLTIHGWMRQKGWITPRYPRWKRQLMKQTKLDK